MIETLLIGLLLYEEIVEPLGRKVELCVCGCGLSFLKKDLSK